MAVYLDPTYSRSYQRGISEEELELDQAEWQFLRSAKDDLSRKERIRRCFGEIRQEMAHLRSLNTSSSEIRGLMRERIQQFEVAELLIAENSAAYTMKKYEHLAGFQKTAAGIEAARPNFTPFAKKKPADTHLPASSQRFLQDRAAAAPLNAVGTVVANAFTSVTPDGSVEPFSKFLLTNPLDLAMDQGRKLLSAVCKSHPLIQQACQKVGLQNILVRERALVLTGSASVDYNGAYPLSLFRNFDNTIVYLALERTYDVTYRRVFDVGSFCRAIDEETAKNGPLNLLILRAHGEERGDQLDTDETFSIFDPLPRDSCLKNLPPNATVILYGCENGKGRENAHNFANHIKRYCPKGVRVFASTEETIGFGVSLNKQIDVKFRSVRFPRPSDDITYKIDDNPRKE